MNDEGKIEAVFDYNRSLIAYVRKLNFALGVCVLKNI